MQSVSDILKKFNPLKDKYLYREYQAFGVYLAQKLTDTQHKSLYIKLAKTVPRSVLQEALRFVSDSNAKKKGALFMWKLKELGVYGQSKKKIHDL
ncbi:MAG: hypothetical protein HYW86_05240 [Candidatus Roizmanbacteria bacterium]|nr:MAG: hypothetical protein HYW86_05240 [Candidatus Roizmanbacteria bacterium]